MVLARLKTFWHFAVITLACCCLVGCLALAGSKSSGGNNTGGGTSGASVGGAPPVAGTPGPNKGATGDLSATNHIVFISQENRSFDPYSGHTNEYRASPGHPHDMADLPTTASNPSFSR